MESPADYDECPLDSDDIYPCKGCGDILEEGKAFELAGNRWHLNCFRCNTCGTLLDSDANLLLLGDGSLICNNCTYSCSACNNKIEDLAILTGDQAFCASCFRCRNCKRKIENLRYARTSQGIFCMSCHESLMARRRKKSRITASNKQKKEDQSSVQVDKLLPALPPNASLQGVLSVDRQTPDPLDPDARTELSPRPRQAYSQNNSSSRSSSRRPHERVPESMPVEEHQLDSLKLPSKTYQKNRHSAISQASDLNENDDNRESFLIPLTLDTVSTPETWQDPSKKSKENNKLLEKDYFAQSRGKSSHQSSTASTPHIALQDRGRESSNETYQIIDSLWKAQSSGKQTMGKKQTAHVGGDDARAQPAKTVSTVTPSKNTQNNKEFTLSKPPQGKKLGTRCESPSLNRDTNSLGSVVGEGISETNLRRENTMRPESVRSAPCEEKTLPSRSSLELRARDDYEVRPSFESPHSTSTISKPTSGGITRSKSRREMTSSTSSRNTTGPGNCSPGNNSSPSSSSLDSPTLTSTGHLNTVSISSDPTSLISNDLAPPTNVPIRPAPLHQPLSNTYLSPRAPPIPSQAAVLAAKEITNTLNIAPSAQGLPRWSQSGGDFTMDEDFARILGDSDDQSQSLLRRVSNIVRHGKNTSEASLAGTPGHGRSASEATTRTNNSPHWLKLSISEDSIPNDSSSLSPDQPALLRKQLRHSEQRVAELEHKFSNEKELKSLIKKVQEKRKTVSVLDSQTEIMIRQLEVLTKYLEKARDTDLPLEVKDLEESAIKDFIIKMETIKQSVTDSIEQLYEERNSLLEERNNIAADRDRALMEFEQLSSKNAQLADMNNDLTYQIQERFKTQTSFDSPRMPSNGLGIHTLPSKDKLTLSMHSDDTTLRPVTSNTILGSGSSYPQVMEQDSSIDPSAVLSAPHLVNIRKGQATKKTFNWKRGRQTVAKGVTKGIKGAFSSNQQPNQQLIQEQARWQSQTGDDIGLPYNLTLMAVDSSTSTQSMGTLRSVPNDQRNQSGFGLFKKSATMSKISSNGNHAMCEKPSILFGSELAERADYERRQIPSVVTRCIEEVELRGMDIEGIYRKTGGNSQIKVIQDGFERMEDFDISDPSLDITAVTSVLKQYLRKLPTPLLTYEVYDRILDSNSIEDHHERCLHLRDTFSMLPPKHRDCLEFLIFHLSRVAVRDKENLMSSKNLAVVFAPTIMRDNSIEREMIDMHAKNTVVQFIIENSYDIFSAQ
ncbi:BgTH12-01536 [Blumeria graminis f. sp. triticale]|uniref:BgTH12-01536 n=1 Tax=Blumeria graminis f. sp. triticale TaxID=1689686 RepID=A0A9W4DGD5_BLUGR|nr:BgTH12-01536 [Blumeria graminis f. sp. triticale]